MQSRSPDSRVYASEHLHWLLKKAEDKSYFDPLDYLISGQFKKNDRENLLTWVIDLTSELNLSMSTGVLACVYLDKFLTSKPRTSPKILELLGIVSLSLAAKLKEGVVFTPEAIKNMLGDRFNIDSIVTTEKYILSVLNWEMSFSTICDLVLALLQQTFEDSLSSTIIQTSFSFAAICYCDADLAVFGSYNLTISSIYLALDRLGFGRVKDEWLQEIESSFVLDKEKLEAIIDQVVKKLSSS
jgi:G2/mitotic-specific cyclin 1/2